jgi:hypothetical protein
MDDKIKQALIDGVICAVREATVADSTSIGKTTRATCISKSAPPTG